MKSDSKKPVIVIVGALTVGLFGFAVVQVVPLVSGASHSPWRLQYKVNPVPVSSVKMDDMPVVTTDPFRMLQAPGNASAPQMATGVQSGSAQSTSVEARPIPTNISGPIGHPLPEIEPSATATTNKPNGQTVAPPNFSISFRGVIIADRTEAYLSVHGKPAKAFALGSEVLPGTTLFNIQNNFIELKSGDEIIRLRVGQEVQL